MVATVAHGTTTIAQPDAHLGPVGARAFPIAAGFRGTYSVACRYTHTQTHTHAHRACPSSDIGRWRRDTRDNTLSLCSTLPSSTQLSSELFFRTSSQTREVVSVYACLSVCVCVCMWTGRRGRRVLVLFFTPKKHHRTVPFSKK